MEDSTIEKSQLFSVTGPRMTMEMQMSQALMQRAYPARNVNVSLIVLPWNVSREQISKLSDVARLGGAIMSTNGFPLIVQKNKVPVKRK